MRKVFVCCRESEKKQLLEKANKVYKGSAVLTPYVEDADVLVIVEEPDDTMQQKIKEAAIFCCFYIFFFSFINFFSTEVFLKPL